MKAPLFALLAALLLLTPNALAAQGETGLFDLKFDSELFSDEADQAFSGDVFIAFSEQGEPRKAMHAWFNVPPVMRFQVEGVVRGQVVRLGLPKATAWRPDDLAQQAAKKWRVQAIVRRSPFGRQAGLSNGDVFSHEAEVQYLAGSDGVLELVLDQQAKEKEFEETERIRLFEFESPALSAFHGTPFTMKAGVQLPENYDPKKKYPVLYSVTGFGGTHHEIKGFLEGQMRPDSPLQQCILVVPDANTRFGHTVFCDSATNGPWGQALVHELIPALEKKYGGAGPQKRFVTGGSSGGWSSLWLQVTYPNQFNGCWSHVPDPIDFHDFQQINLYDPVDENTPRNMY
ncbi:MAG: alpha/beta hydrolase-fold protein, partial [Planctomycetota bacterium]|nr:alpha/beta hydrolase-fold protein [Planctomycetota bacterium]